MAVNYLENPLVIVLVGIVIAAIVISTLIKKRKLPGFKEFKPKLFADTIYDEMKKKLDTHGIGLRGGKLYLGIKEIGRIDKYYIGKGTFSLSIYDLKTKSMKTADADKDEPYSFLFIRAKSNNILFRLFGMGKIYYILKQKDGKENEIVKFDHASKRMFLPQDIDLTSYGGVWLNSEDGAEYVNDISMKRMNEQTQMHLENLPDKVVHLEIEQAKKERLATTFTDLEKTKWEAKKYGGDSTVT